MYYGKGTAPPQITYHARKDAWGNFSLCGIKRDPTNIMPMNFGQLGNCDACKKLKRERQLRTKEKFANEFGTNGTGQRNPNHQTASKDGAKDASQTVSVPAPKTLRKGSSSKESE